MVLPPMVPLMQQGDEKAAIFYNNLLLFVLIRKSKFTRLRRGANIGRRGGLKIKNKRCLRALSVLRGSLLYSAWTKSHKIVIVLNPGRIYRDTGIPSKRYNILFLMGSLQPVPIRRDRSRFSWYIPMSRGNDKTVLRFYWFASFRSTTNYENRESEDVLKREWKAHIAPFMRSCAGKLNSDPFPLKSVYSAYWRQAEAAKQAASAIDISQTARY